MLHTTLAVKRFTSGFTAILADDDAVKLDDDLWWLSWKLGYHREYHVSL